MIIVCMFFEIKNLQKNIMFPAVISNLRGKYRKDIIEDSNKMPKLLFCDVK